MRIPKSQIYTRQIVNIQLELKNLKKLDFIIQKLKDFSQEGKSSHDISALNEHINELDRKSKNLKSDLDEVIANIPFNFSPKNYMVYSKYNENFEIEFKSINEIITRLIELNKDHEFKCEVQYPFFCNFC